jgi:hypothetical protein
MSSFQLDLDKREFFCPWIDNIVLDADRPGVCLSELQFRHLMPIRGLSQKLAGR